jgi:cytochrome P450
METQSYFEELTKYKSEISTGESTDDTRIMDLMGNLSLPNFKQVLIHEAPLVKASQITPKESNGIYLTKQEVIADTWTLVFAGHETTANAFHYTLVFLASDLETQIELQRDIDSIVGERHQDTWTYEKDLPAFFNNFVGACIFETLRLMPPVPELPKVARAGPRPLTIGGKTYTVPQETFIHVDMGGAQRNPAYWPHSASKVRNRKDDMYDYVPQRWLINRNDGTAQTFSAADADGLEKASFEATSGGLFVPIKGSYLPFAEGVRSCPGRRFAQVELTAVLSSLLNEYSVEMDVSNFATDEEVDRMDMQERKAIYEKARARARHIVDSSVYQAAMRMPTPVQLRLVRRGNERFMNCYV